MNHRDFIIHLKERLSSPLPGWHYQQLMSPLINGQKTHEPRNIPEDAHLTGVAALLFPSHRGTELIFTMRSQTVSHHKGQISFPGGRSEPHETIEDTALRETQEEIGIEKHAIEVIGRLTSLYVPPSHSLMHVIVGSLEHEPEYMPNHSEVEEVFTVSLKQLAFDVQVEHLPKMRSEHMEVLAPCWNIHPKGHLWGATAMCVSELVGLYRDFVDANN